MKISKSPNVNITTLSSKNKKIAASIFIQQKCIQKTFVQTKNATTDTPNPVPTDVYFNHNGQTRLNSFSPRATQHLVGPNLQ